MTNVDIPEFLTPAELAERLGCSVQALRVRRQKGTGPKFRKVGARVFYSPEDVAEWIGDPVSSTAEARNR